MPKTKKIQYRPGSLLPHIAELTREGHSLAATARTMAARYAEMCRRSLPVLEPSEWRVVLEAVQWHVPTVLDDWRIHAEDLVTLDGAAKRHGVPDADRFLEQLRAMSFAEATAALDWAERYWAAVSRGEVARVPGEERYRQHSAYHEGAELGYLDGAPVYLVDGYGAARCSDGDGVLLDSGEWLAVVEDGEWRVRHSSAWGSLPCPVEYREIDLIGDDDLAAETRRDVGCA